MRDDLAKHKVDFTRHVGGVTADVKVSLLLQEAAHQIGVFTQSVLNIHLLGSFTRKRSNDLKLVPKLFLVGLLKAKELALFVADQ